MSEPEQKCEKNPVFKQNYTAKLLITFKMANSCCFSLGGNLDFLQKQFYNIHDWRQFSLSMTENESLFQPKNWKSLKPQRKISNSRHQKSRLKLKNWNRILTSWTRSILGSSRTFWSTGSLAFLNFQDWWRWNKIKTSPYYWAII